MIRFITRFLVMGGLLMNIGCGRKHDSDPATVKEDLATKRSMWAGPTLTLDELPVGARKIGTLVKDDPRAVTIDSSRELMEHLTPYMVVRLEKGKARLTVGPPSGGRLLTESVVYELLGRSSQRARCGTGRPHGPDMDTSAAWVVTYLLGQGEERHGLYVILCQGRVQQIYVDPVAPERKKNSQQENHPDEPDT